MTKQLSPAAEAVLNAATEAQYGSCYTQFERISSAVLRAAADQVLPEQTNSVGDEHDEARRDQWMRIRLRFLALAAELEGSDG